ncbi:hypothetical protein BSLG_005775 [Batrachochytrium salamandrivorans]|nr:hypothetical protein BSLG_005775 [Batrachochytrium salamandrivorans]
MDASVLTAMDMHASANSSPTLSFSSTGKAKTSLPHSVPNVVHTTTTPTSPVATAMSLRSDSIEGSVASTSSTLLVTPTHLLNLTPGSPVLPSPVETENIGLKREIEEHENLYTGRFLVYRIPVNSPISNQICASNNSPNPVPLSLGSSTDKRNSTCSACVEYNLQGSSNGIPVHCGCPPVRHARSRKAKISGAQLANRRTSMSTLCGRSHIQSARKRAGWQSSIFFPSSSATAVTASSSAPTLPIAHAPISTIAVQPHSNGTESLSHLSKCPPTPSTNMRHKHSFSLSSYKLKTDAGTSV